MKTFQNAGEILPLNHILQGERSQHVSYITMLDGNVDGIA